MKKFIENFYKKKHFFPRLIALIISLIIMGLCMSLLIKVDWGTDPYTFMNRSIAMKLGLSIGTWQTILNSCLLVIVLIAGGRNIGFGTIFNIFLPGYCIDFFSWVWDKTLPANFFDPIGVKIGIFIPVVIIFAIAVAIYINMDLGTAPNDAIPIIISDHVPKVNFRWIRMGFDALTIIVGLCLGGTIQVVTILMALLFGPTISYVGKLIGKKWDFKEPVS